MVRRTCIRTLVLPLGLALSCAACSLTVSSRSGPPRIESDGLLEGHAAVGLRDEPHILHLHILGGSSDGALAELVLWKLFRAEVGLLGASLGVGPFDVALGTLFYDPELPEFVRDEDEEGAQEERAESDAPDSGTR
jgi:hypothetical protein